MTVRELIQELAALDPDAPVLLYETGGEGTRQGYVDAQGTTVVHVAPRAPGGLYPQFCHLPEKNTVAAVWIE